MSFLLSAYRVGKKCSRIGAVLSEEWSTMGRVILIPHQMMRFMILAVNEVAKEDFHIP